MQGKQYFDQRTKYSKQVNTVDMGQTSQFSDTTQHNKDVANLACSDEEFAFVLKLENPQAPLFSCSHQWCAYENDGR